MSDIIRKEEYQMPRDFRDGVQLEEYFFGPSPTERPKNGKSLITVRGRFSEFARNVVTASMEECPETTFAQSLRYWVATYLERMGVASGELKLFASGGSEADIYYFTDALFYLDVGQESFASVDSFLVQRIDTLRDFWISDSTVEVFTEEHFQSCLFHHKVMIYQYKKDRMEKGLEDNLSSWILSTGYKEAWPSYASWKIDDPDRPDQRPENHFLATQWHLPLHRRHGLARSIAMSMAKQIHDLTILPAVSY